MSSHRVLAPLPRPDHTSRRALRAAAVGSAVLLGLAGCGGSEGTDGDGGGGEGEANPSLDAVTVDGAYGEQPTIDFEAPLELDESASEVLSVGDGEELAEGDTVTVDYAVVSGADGSELDTSFGASPVSLPLLEGETNPGLIEALVGATLGSRVLVVVAPPPTAEGATPAPGSQDSIVFVLDLLSVLPERAEGEPVDPVDGVPTVETDEAGDVTGLSVEGAEPPTELVVTPLIEGEGEEVQPGDTVTIHYTGVLAADGSEFDSSWGRAPATFPLTGLIQAWQEGIPGVAVGSRIVLQVPPELGYGEAGSPPTIPANADLVFVIDVLATERTVEPSAPAPAPSR